MLELSKIIELLQDRRPGVVARETGVHVNTIIKIKKGGTPNPTYDTWKALSDYFTKNQ